LLSLSSQKHVFDIGNVFEISRALLGRLALDAVVSRLLDLAADRVRGSMAANGWYTMADAKAH
jgi:hypothetical protein